MKIFDKKQNLLLEIDVDDNSYRNRVIMGDHTLTLYYSLAEHIEIPIGGYCVYEGETYTLMRPENLKMQHKHLYEYTVVFSSEQEKAKIWKFRNPVDGRLKFPLTAKPKEHLQMLVDNMNRRDSGWTLGDCIEDVEKLVSYDHDFCWDALGKIANEFQTEFEIVGKKVSLKKVEYNKSQPLPLAYGRGNGFKPGVGRSNTSDALPVEILFVQGGDTNIDRSKYPADENLRAISNGCLLLPTGQTIGYDGEHFEGEEEYNSESARHYQVDDLGLSIRNVDRELSSMAEDSLDRSDDYPKRVGTISQVVIVDKDKNFYDIIDSSIPEDLNYEDYLIGDEKMTIIFQTGELAGREFEVKYYHKAKTINGMTKAARRFEIVPQEIDGVMMPGESFIPSQRDKYAVFHVMLPNAYIREDNTKTGASWEMFKSAVRYLFDNEEKKFSFTGELDSIWAKKNWLNVGGKIKLGGFIKFTHEQIAPEGVLARITSIKDYVNKPHSPKIEISNDTISASVSTTLKTLESTEVVIEENYRSAIQFTKRRFRDAKETIEMIESALSDNFTNRINPIAVETMSLLIGDERLQYQFVEAPENTTAVPHNITFEEDTKQLVAPAGTIQHLTLGIDSIRPSHEPNEYLYWNVEAFRSAILTDGSEKYYLYIKAQKEYNGTFGNAEFKLETISHQLEEGAYYWLLVGILNTEYDGERSFATLYGFTEILPGRITADRLLASDGESYFDMLNAAMKLKDKLVFNKDGDGELRIKGVIVQSQNGVDEAPIGCFRGEYNDLTTYFNGDEVTFSTNEDSPKSSYRCISPTAITGTPPTDSLKWQVIAAGIKGEPGKDGSSININGTFKAHYTTESEWSSAISTDSLNIGDIYLVDSDSSAGGRKCIVLQYSQSPGFLPQWVKSYATAGDAYISAQEDTKGDLFISSSQNWENVGRVQGAKGEPGKDGEQGAAGNYTEYRFAVNGKTTEAPYLVNNSLSPMGWLTTMPPVNKGFYLWMTKAIKNGAGTALITTWSSPVRITPQDGKDGSNGLSPAMVYRGIYNSEKTYTGNQYRVDCVKQGEAYFVAQTDAGDFSGVQPPNTSKWNPFGASFESVATDLLLAENANIGGWIFRNGQLESQAVNANGEPMAYLNGNEGNGRFAGTLQLSCNYEGKITDSNLFYLPPTNKQIALTMGTAIDDIGKVVRLHNGGKSSNANYKIQCPTFGVKGNLIDVSQVYEVVIKPQETVEITCFRQPGSKYPNQASWQITGRHSFEDFRTNNATGRYIRALAVGRITIGSTSSIEGKLYDGRDLSSVFSLQRTEIGKCHISFSEGLIGSSYHILCSGYGANLKGSVSNCNATGFNLFISDDATLNDGTVELLIIDDNWWYDKSII